MTNNEVAIIFNTLGKIMELHGENPFKTRSYSNAYLLIRKLPKPVIEMPLEELRMIDGIGKAISEKIVELRETAQLQTLNKYLEMTPPGVVELLKIRGLGVKKIRIVWMQLGIESPGDLLYACNENRLVGLKGFGVKTQEQLKNQLTYFLESSGKFLYGHIIDDALEILSILQGLLPEAIIVLTGDLDRKNPIVSVLKFLSTADKELCKSTLDVHKDFQVEDDCFRFKELSFLIEHASEENFWKIKFENSCSKEFLEYWHEQYGDLIVESDEEDLFDGLGLAFIPPESRENARILDRAHSNGLALIQDDDIRGVIHLHSAYSDGVNTIQEMADYAHSLGYEYMLITDHSKSAFYANGLQEERLILQWNEIDSLNDKLDNFKIFKGIESDILNDGSLDYPQDILKQFDCIIASVHSNLKMDINKAMHRLIKAVENPYTRILGHPTGRLLLSRKGYPIDHRRLIDACIANDVVIEINANPHRLDIDWQWIDYIMEKDGMLSINPDAHSTSGILDTKFGVIAARKGGLMPEYCLNTKSMDEFKKWILLKS